jgi:hypothetical protein
MMEAVSASETSVYFNGTTRRDIPEKLSYSSSEEFNGLAFLKYVLSSSVGRGSFLRGLKRGWNVTLTTHPHLVPKSRKSRSYTSSPPSASVVCSGTALALALA